MTTNADTTQKLPTLPPVSRWELGGLPAVGAEWPGQGGVFAGLIRGEHGAPDYLLILGPEREMEASWQAAMDWAAGLQEEGHQDFTLPSRAEQAVLFGNCRDRFERDYYWSREQHAEDADYAWSQYFGDGDQSCNHKNYEWRARAVRRLVIQ